MVPRPYKIAYAMCLAMTVFGIAYDSCGDGGEKQGQLPIRAQQPAPAHAVVTAAPTPDPAPAPTPDPAPAADVVPPAPRAGIDRPLETPPDSDGFRAHYECGVVSYEVPDNLNRRDPAMMDAHGRLVVYRDPGMTQPFDDAWYHSLEQGEHRLITRVNHETNTAEIVVISYLGMVDEAGNNVYETHDGYVDYGHFGPCTSRDCGLRGSG